MYNLPNEFLKRMKAELGDEFSAFLQSYNTPLYKAIRVNTLNISPSEFKKISPFSLEQVEWEECGFYITEEKPGKFLHHFAGLYYVQEPSAMSAAPALGEVKGKTILDLCSAPGGKGTQIAQKMQGEGVLFLNEINFSRAKLLSQNVERMGVKNAVVTCASPADLAKNYPSFFDKILVDAPCSGEGMFKTKDAAIPNWSKQNVELCANRQKEILSYADKLLKSGGTLVYSTCTFAPEEDELQIQNFLSKYPEYELLSTKKSLPHKIKGAGHFVAKLIKKQSEQNASISPIVGGVKDKKLLQEYKNFEKSYLKTTFTNLYLVGENLYSLPQNCPKLLVQTLRAGVHLGEFVKGRFMPSHSLAMCLKNTEANFVEVDEKTAFNYLNGLTFNCSENLKGWHLVTYLGYSLGWCKCVNGTAKNHFPKGLRTKIESYEEDNF